MTAIQTVGSYILNTLHQKLKQPENACNLVRACIKTHGEDSPELYAAVLDKFHMELPYPTEACAIIRGAMLAQGIPIQAAA